MSIIVPVPGNVGDTSLVLPLDVPTADEITVANALELIAWFTGYPHYRAPDGGWWDRAGGRKHYAAPNKLSPVGGQAGGRGGAFQFEGNQAIDVQPGNFLPTGAYTFYLVMRTSAVLANTVQVWGCPNRAAAPAGSNGACLTVNNTSGSLIWIHANPTWATPANIGVGNLRNYINEKILVRGSISATGTAVLEINGFQDDIRSAQPANTNTKIYIGDAPGRQLDQPYLGTIFDALFFNGDVPVANPTLAATIETMLVARNPGIAMV